jgi:hypothetical protein
MRTLLAVVTTGLLALAAASFSQPAVAGPAAGVAAGVADAAKTSGDVETVHYRRRGRGIYFSFGYGVPRYYGYGYGYRPYYYYGSPYYYYTPRYYYKKRKYRRYRHW